MLLTPRTSQLASGGSPHGGAAGRGTVGEFHRSLPRGCALPSTAGLLCGHLAVTTGIQLGAKVATALALLRLSQLASSALGSRRRSSRWRGLRAFSGPEAAALLEERRALRASVVELVQEVRKLRSAIAPSRVPEADLTLSPPGDVPNDATTRIKVVSAGRDGGDIADFFSDDHMVPIIGSEDRRGLNVVVIDPRRQAVVSAKSFDVWGNPAANKQFSLDMQELPDGHIVLAAIKDSGGEKLNMDSLEALESLGSLLEDRLGFREGYALIGVKGGRRLAELRAREASDKAIMIEADLPFPVQTPAAVPRFSQAERSADASSSSSRTSSTSHTRSVSRSPAPAPATASSPSEEGLSPELAAQKARLQEDMIRARSTPRVEEQPTTWEEVVIMLDQWDASRQMST